MGRNPDFSLAENTDDLFVGKTLLHGSVLMLLMKTLLTSQCINQRGAGDDHLANAAARNRVWLFVLPPEDVLNSAQILIFTPSRKIPFAGHPNVGTVLVAPAGGGQGEAV